MKYAIKLTAHDEVERLGSLVLEQSVAICRLENGREKYRWTNVGRLERQRRKAVAELLERMDETA